MLVDLEGDDGYEADANAQGAAAWGIGLLFGYRFLDGQLRLAGFVSGGIGALGLLVDGGGSDRYRCSRYGLGGAVHQSAALLLDLGGADRYDCKTMSLGAANAAGAFGHNAGGSDRYRGDGTCFGKVVRGEYQPGMRPVSRALFPDTAGKDSYEGREGAEDGRRWEDPDFPDLAVGADR